MDPAVPLTDGEPVPVGRDAAAAELDPTQCRISLHDTDLWRLPVAAFDATTGRLAWQNPAFAQLVAQAPAAAAALAVQLPEAVCRGAQDRAVSPEIPRAAVTLAAQPFDLHAMDGPGRRLLLALPAPAGTPGYAGPERGEADSVTGIPGRQTLAAELAERFRDRRRRPFALLFVDLDGFKQVNDSHGHLAGDRTLREAAQRFRGVLREGDYVGRFGGDEFVIVVDGPAIQPGLDAVVQRLQAAMAQPLPGAGTLTVSASIGWARSADGFETVEQMIDAADRDMYARKRSGS
ncbi:MAG: GGDEF domain-containing protein [Planctomycetota bacterium]